MSAAPKVSIPGDPPVLDIDPYSNEVLENPYPFYKKLRETAPIVTIAAHGVYAVGGYEEVKEVFSTWENFTAESGVGIQDARDPSAGARPKSLLVEIDPPEHTSNRRAANKIMSPIIIRKFRETFEARAAELVNKALANGGRCDGVSDLVEALVLTAFPKAMGLRADPDAYRAIGYMSFNQTGPKNDLHRKGLAVGEPYLEWFMDSCKRENVSAGSLSDEFFKAEEAGQVSPGFAANVLRSLVRGGSDSTMSGMATAVHQLARNPDQWDVLKQNPARRRFVFDEALRYESPFHVVYRATAKEQDFHGYHLKNNTKLAMFPGAANRDPRKWENPDKFDIMRDTAGVHMSFGTADHNCIGQNIARLEADCLLVALTDRVARIELIGEPTYKLHNQLRTLGTLPLRLVAV